MMCVASVAWRLMDVRQMESILETTAQWSGVFAATRFISNVFKNGWQAVQSRGAPCAEGLGSTRVLTRREQRSPWRLWQAALLTNNSDSGICKH